MEVFVGEGERTLTGQAFPRDDSRALRLFARGGTVHFSGVQAWTLASARFD